MDLATRARLYANDQKHILDSPFIHKLADEIERLTAATASWQRCADEARAKLATVEAAITGTGGDADRSEFHRGWAACCKMVAAICDREQELQK